MWYLELSHVLQTPQEPLRSYVDFFWKSEDVGASRGHIWKGYCDTVRKWTRWTSQMLKSWSKLLIQCLNRQIPHWLSPLHFLSGSFMTSWWLISGESHQKDHQSGFTEAVWHWLGKEQSVHSHWVWKLLVSIGITVDGLWKHTHIFSTSDY